MQSALKISGNRSCFADYFGDFVDKYVALWQNVSEKTPFLSKIYTGAEQRVFECETSRLIDAMESELRRYPGKEKPQSAWRKRMFQLLRGFAATSFCLPDRHCDIIFSREYIASTIEFIRKGREFAPRMEPSDLAQALRNVWVMNCLQLFLGQHPLLTPSIFAYSMLYPYTDNFLDNPNLSLKTKEAACRRLELRLSGHAISSNNPHETAVFQLVEMIENDYPRSLFPDVYSSLLAIHSGQIQSLRQNNMSDLLDERQLLRISVTKGGSSVLTDGWLVAGILHREQAGFFFGYGVMLQLLDDLQDLTQDRVAGHQTIFTRLETTEQLECLTNRLWAFISEVLNSTGCFTNPQDYELKDLIRYNSMMLILRAIAECPDSYSDGYLKHMERFSPLSFAYLRRCSEDMKARFEKIWPRLARRRKLRSVFDLIGLTGQIPLPN